MNDLYKKIRDKNIRSTLKYAVIDGILWSCMFGMSEDYLIPFALHFKSSPLFISLLTGIAQLGISIFQILGAQFIVHYKKRKFFIILSNQLHAFSWIFILVFTYITKNPLVIIIFYFIGNGATNFAAPAWLSWMNETVPPHLRGEYWGKRLRIMGFFQFLATSTAGFILYYFKNIVNNELIGFGIIFVIATLFRALSIFPISKMVEAPMCVPERKQELTLFTFFKKSSHANFIKFILFSVMMTFSVNLLAPMLPIHILKTLKFNYIFFALITMTANITIFLSTAYWGPLIDRFGNYAIMQVCAIGIILPPLLWTFISHLYLILFIQIIAGFMWAGFTLSTLNFIFDSVKKEHISYATAITTSLNNIMAFLGSITSGFISLLAPKLKILHFSALNLEIVFLSSFLARLATVLFFSKSFKEVRRTPPVPSHIHFLIYDPARNIYNQIEIFYKKIKKVTKLDL